jgi:lipopolysaccharide transport system ATP-binding protein
MQNAIEIDHLWKEYRLGVIGSGALYRDVQSWWARLRGRDDPNSKINPAVLRSERAVGDRFQALRDVNLDIPQGEALGIVGRNGAGKSTLLKILSRVTAPTRGEIRVRGRLASLLEVGTGFHPELTGRENIYMNGVILGLTRAEVRQRFDQIVAFAEIGPFLETPVKRYSSGMYVRLAFAVAAHLEPEILVVDEVLAVGDVEFRKKCLGRMGEVAKEGRTVLFVSHNTHAVQQLCTSAVLLEEGQVVATGSAREVVERYLGAGLARQGERVWPDLAKAPGSNAVRLLAIRTLRESGEVASEFKVTEPFSVELEFAVLEAEYVMDVGFHFMNDEGDVLFTASDFQDDTWLGRKRPTGRHKVRAHVPANLLNNGALRVMPWVVSNPGIMHAREHDALVLDIVDDFGPGGARGHYAEEWSDTAFRPMLRWSYDHDPKLPLAADDRH